MHFGIDDEKVVVKPQEFYDLATDPKEQHDLSDLEPGRLGLAKEALIAEMRRLDKAGEGLRSSSLGQAALTTMKQAGYLHQMPTPQATAARDSR